MQSRRFGMGVSSLGVMGVSGVTGVGGAMRCSALERRGFWVEIVATLRDCISGFEWLRAIDLLERQPITL